MRTVRSALVATALLAVLAALVPTPATATPREVIGSWDRHAAVVNGSYLPLVGDFNGDHADDILWYAPGPALDPLWIGRAGQRGQQAFEPVMLNISKHYQPFVGDFDGDDQDDIFWYAPGRATDLVWRGGRGRGSFEQRFVVQDGTYRPIVLEDRNPGGKDDIIWYAPGPAPDEVWVQSDGDARPDLVRPLRIDGRYTAIVGDWSGDGVEEPMWYAPGPAADHRWTALGDGRFASHPRPVSGRYAATAVPGQWGRGGRNDDILWIGASRSDRHVWVNVEGHFVTSRRLIGDLDTGPSVVALGQQTVRTALIFGGDDPLRAYSRMDESWIRDASAWGDSQRGQVPLVGDFDADGFEDIVWYGPGSTPDAIWYEHRG